MPILTFPYLNCMAPVPIIDGIEDPSTTSFDYARGSVDEMVTYIDNLYQEVLEENNLPETLRKIDEITGEEVENMNEMVRPTKAVVLALRAKLWVYAASKLFNGGYAEALDLVNNDGKHLFSAKDPGKWDTAKNIWRHSLSLLKIIITNSSVYSTKKEKEQPSLSVYRVFQEYNKEIIWATSQSYMSEVNNGQHLDRRCRPTAIMDGFSGIGVSQQAVDAFFTKNGLDINEDPEHDETGFSDIENPCAYKKRR